MGLLSGRPLKRSFGGTVPPGQMWGIANPSDLVPRRIGGGPGGAPVVTQNSALQHSAVWACLRQRADLVSTFPIDVYRRVNGIQVQVPTPPVLANPAGRLLGQGDTGILEWLYSTQMDLDRAGNTIGIITARDGLGLPARIELAPVAECSVIVKGGQVANYRICGTLHDPAVIWHERAFTVPGLFVGLSPVAYAAWAIGEYLSVQQFAMAWFGGGAVPRAELKNTAKKIEPKEAAVVKETWRAAITVGEPFVHGNDWEYSMIQAEQASADWLEAKKYSVTDIARFFGVPSDLIDSGPTGATRQMIYANISQRNLQLLTMNLGPAIIRREAALSGLLPQPRYIRFNTDALLRLDPATRAAAIQTQINSRTLTISEARELENRRPLTQKDIDEFLTFWPPAGGGPSGPATGTPAGGDDSNQGGDQGEIDPGQTVPAIGS
jgi:HK97 family phage portal protein